LRQHTHARRPRRTPPVPSRPILRANPFPEVADLICRLPLISFFYKTRGLPPRSPDAVNGTTGRENNTLPRVFKERRQRSGRCETRTALPPRPAASPSKTIPRPVGLCQQEKRTLAGTGAAVRAFVCVAAHYPNEFRPMPEYYPASLSRGPDQNWSLSPEIALALRIDSPSSKCCSRGTLLHFSRLWSQKTICYYHQNLHWRQLHARSRGALRRPGRLLSIASTPSYSAASRLRRWRRIGPALQRHPF